MTSWFAPTLLARLLLRVIIADVFGQYADRRLLSAALDPVTKDVHRQRADLRGRLPRAADGAIWFDYAADLGDGFDATYAIAALMAEPSLTVGGYELPRTGLTVLGGDQVYPTAGAREYKERMRKPYEFARPGSEDGPGALLLALPGNHHWYDGLVSFLGIFAREKPTAIGAWRTVQRRSYFAAQLDEKWWIWGIDIALVRDMDQPQADYFVGIAEGMREGANIILCSAEPGWYTAETEGDSYRTLSYAAWIAENVGKDLTIPLVLSGDSHHFAHYEGAGTHYITSGGGGAFLHGTHGLKDTIKARWLRNDAAELRLRSCHPAKAQSRRMLLGNLFFPLVNPAFALTIGALYCLCIFILSATRSADVAAGLFLATATSLYFYASYQEKEGSVKLALLAVVHATAHALVVLALGAAVLWLWMPLAQAYTGHWLAWLAALAIVMVPAGAVFGGGLYGLYLMLSCLFFDVNHNDAFSAMRLASHRNFLRIRIAGDKVTVFPVALDVVPRRWQWRLNPERRADKTAPVFVSGPPLAPTLACPPIEIEARHAASTDALKTPNELPPMP